jgi:hypothetical protein
MRALLLLFLAACELEPAPKVAPKPVAPPPAAAPAPAPAPAPVPAAPIVDACTDAAVKYVEIQIAEAKDPVMKQNLEIERARTVLRIETGCRAQKWSAEITDCYKAAKTVGDLQICTKKLQPVPPPANAPKAPQPDKPIDKPSDKPAGKAAKPKKP